MTYISYEIIAYGLTSHIRTRISILIERELEKYDLF